MGLTLLLDELVAKDESPAEENNVSTDEALSTIGNLQTEVIKGWRGLTNDVLSNATSAVDVLNDLYVSRISQRS